MRYRGDDFYSIAMDIIDSQHTCIFDLAEQLLNTDTKEGLLENVQLLSRYVGEYFWEDDGLKNNAPLHYPAHTEAQSVLFDKLIEFSYRIHKDKWNKGGIGYFMHNWTAQPVPKDDTDFEHYLKTLKS